MINLVGRNACKVPCCICIDDGYVDTRWCIFIYDISKNKIQLKVMFSIDANINCILLLYLDLIKVVGYQDSGWLDYENHLTEKFWLYKAKTAQKFYFIY